MACIDEIVTLGICPDDAASKSGFTLITAPGISSRNLANTANEDYVNGTHMAMQKKTIAINQVKNDFIGALQANQVVASISHPVYETAIVNPNVSMGTYAGYRGVVIHKAGSYRGTLRKTLIKSIDCYPLASGNGTIKIIDGYKEVSYDVTFVANQVNTFTSTQLEGFPYEMESQKISVLIDNTTIPFASSRIKCGKGCNGTIPNPCGWADGWNGTGAVKGEGYGLNVNFYCDCDYTQILCDLSNTFSGELIWLKWQIAVFEEQYLSNRFDNIVVYGHDDIKNVVLPDLNKKYAQKWNDMMSGLYGILNTYRDDCLNCRGIRRRANI